MEPRGRERHRRSPIWARERERRSQTPYNFQTVFPPTIVRTARPFSFQPSNGQLREADSKRSTLTVHSNSGLISVTSARAPIDNVPALIFNKLAGSTVYISISRAISILP